MERSEMVKRYWKPYMVIDYQDNGMQYPASCLLLCIDFDCETMRLVPINTFYEQKEFVANIKYCSIPKKLKSVVINGKSVYDPTDNYIKSKIDP